MRNTLKYSVTHSDLMLIIRFLRNKHLFQLQVQAFDATPQPRCESVQWQQGHRLQKQSNGGKYRVCFFVHLELLSFHTCAKSQRLKVPIFFHI